MTLHTRRELLASAALASAGLAGCSQLTALNSSGPIEASAAGSESPFSWTATLASAMTDNNPPRIQLTLRNDSAESERVQFGPVPPFCAPLSGTETSDTRLVLFHADMGPSTAPETRIDGCWQLDPDDPRLAIHRIANEEALGPDEQVSSTYSLYGALPAETCFPDGEYTFRDTATLQSGDEQSLDLEFGVQIEDGRVADLTASQSIGAVESTPDS